MAIGSVANLIAEPWQATLIGALGYVCVCLALCVHACDRVWEIEYHVARYPCLSNETHIPMIHLASTDIFVCGGHNRLTPAVMQGDCLLICRSLH